MRQTVVGIFTHQGSAEATLRRLELRGFDVECVNGSLPRGPTTAVQIGRAAGGDGLWDAVRKRLRSIAEAVLREAPLSQAPRQGETHVRVRTNTLLEAQAAREILRASGAQPSGCLGEGWTNWNW